MQNWLTKVIANIKSTDSIIGLLYNTQGETLPHIMVLIYQIIFRLDNKQFYIVSIGIHISTLGAVVYTRFILPRPP